MQRATVALLPPDRLPSVSEDSHRYDLRNRFTPADLELSAPAKCPLWSSTLARQAHPPSICLAAKRCPKFG